MQPTCGHSGDMTSPLDIDLRLRDLLDTLSLPLSLQGRLRLIASFIRSLGDDLGPFDSFLVEVAQAMSVLGEETLLVGMSPEELTGLLEPTLRLERAVPAIGSLPGWRELEAALKHHAALSFGFVGDLTAAAGVLNCTPPSAEAVTDPLPSRRVGEFPLQMLCRACLKGDHRSAPHSALIPLLQQWTAALEDGPVSAVVPFVEIAPQGLDDDRAWGVPRRVALDIVGTRTDEDRLYPDIIVRGATDASWTAYRNACLAARRLFTEHHASLRDVFYTGHLTTHQTGTLLDGSSSNLAAALMMYCAVLRHANRRRQYRLSRTVAITGDVTEDGTVKEVDAITLEHKVSGVFFSPCETLVVPFTQREEADRAVRLLQERFPDRRLDIIGVKQLYELFYDLRIVEPVTISRVRHLAMWGWRKRFRVAAVVMILALTTLLAHKLTGPLDRNPASLAWGGSTLFGLNARGDTVRRIPVGTETVREVIDPNFIAGGGSLASIVDVNGDQSNEIVYIRRAGPGIVGNDSVVCRNEAGVVWAKIIAEPLCYPFKGDVGTGFNASRLASGAFLRGEGNDVVVCAPSIQSFPTVIVLLDGMTGAERRKYINAGHMICCGTADLDGNGLLEILVGGSNNSFDLAAFAILDPHTMQGYSPIGNPDYSPLQSTTGCEFAYFVFPQSPPIRLFQKEMSRPQVGGIQVDSQRRRIFVTVCEGTLADYRGRPPALTYIFGFDCAIQTVQLSDSYVQFVRHLSDARRATCQPDAMDIEALKDSIFSWRSHH
jgi:hypothetical protein